jgi:arsenate reductase
MTIIYGIKNCDTMKKAMKWLIANNIEYTFHDYKKEGLDSKTLKSWLKTVDWEILLNRRGTTWRKLPEDIKENINKASAINIMLENLSIIKRPVLNVNGVIYVGFNENNYQEIFKK